MLTSKNDTQLKDFQSIATSTDWYNHFASLGIDYGEHFRLLRSVQNFQNTAVASLDHLSDIPDESTYLVHPTILDAALQLCLIAGYRGIYKNLAAPSVPYKIRRLRLWCRDQSQPKNSIVSVARGSTYDTGKVCSEMEIYLDGQRLLEATDIILVAFDQSSSKDNRDTEPFSRISWKPDIDHLNSETIKSLYPPVSLDKASFENNLDVLALNLLIQFHETHQDVFKTGHKAPHLNHFLDWISERVALAHNGHYSYADPILQYTIDERAIKIESLSKELCATSSEARLFCHIYQNLNSILSGRTTGIEIALEDDRLNDLYKEGHRVSEGNRRLGNIAGLLGQKNPNISILEVGAGTGSATAEILNCLHGEGENRLYGEYAFTDITPSFLNGAKVNFAGFHGVNYFPFNMEDVKGAEKLGSVYDAVIASNVSNS